MGLGPVEEPWAGRASGAGGGGRARAQAKTAVPSWALNQSTRTKREPVRTWSGKLVSLSGREQRSGVVGRLGGGGTLIKAPWVWSLTHPPARACPAAPAAPRADPRAPDDRAHQIGHRLIPSHPRRGSQSTSQRAQAGPNNSLWHVNRSAVQSFARQTRHDCRSPSIHFPPPLGWRQPLSFATAIAPTRPASAPQTSYRFILFDTTRNTLLSESPQLRRGRPYPRPATSAEPGTSPRAPDLCW